MQPAIEITPESVTVGGIVYYRSPSDLAFLERQRNLVLRVVHNFDALVAFVRRNENQPYAVEFLKRLGEN